MDICVWTSRRVAPEAGSSRAERRSPPPLPRVNGWSRPIHAPQVVVWTMLLALAFASFGIFIPLLPNGLRLVAYSVSFSLVTGGLLLLHLIVLVTAITIDPAEPSVRCKNYRRPKTIFVRSKLSHFTEASYCHLCQVTVSARAKHCRACNKCTAGFDHHCKWINNCVGSRNYWWFFSSVVSAVAYLLCLMIIVMYIMVQYRVNKEALRSDPHFEKITDENTWLLFLPFFAVKIQAPVLLTIGASMLVLLFSGLLMLGYLLLFHLNLLAKGLTTLEYIKLHQKKSRENSTPKKEPVVQMEEGHAQKTMGECQGARNPVEGKGVENGGLATGVGSSKLSGSFNLDACSSIKIPRRNQGHASLMPLYSSNSDIWSVSSKNIQSLPQRSQKPCSSMPTTISASSQLEEELVIHKVDPLPHDKLPEGTEEKALGRATLSTLVVAGPLEAQGQTSTDLCPVLIPEPSDASGEALKPRASRMLQLKVIPMDNASEISEEGDLQNV